MRSIFILLLMLTLTTVVQGQGGETPTEDSLMNKELFEFKKESLLHDVTSTHKTFTTIMNQRWQFRVLVLIISAAFLGLAAANTTFRRLSLPRWFPYVSTLVFLGLCFFYDCYTASVQETTQHYEDWISTNLNDLPEKSRAGLIAIDSHRSLVEICRRFLAASVVTRQLDRLAIGFTSMAFVSFYLLILLMWVAGWFIKSRASNG